MALEVISAKRKTSKGVSRKPDVLPGQLLFMNPKDFRTHPTFENLLRIEDGLLERTTEDMRANGFYRSKPITLAVWDGQDEPVIADGHMRRQASIDAGITSVPYVIEKFADEKAAFEYAVNCQEVKRKTTDGALYRLCVEYDKQMRRGGDRRSKEAKSKITGVFVDPKVSTSARMTAAFLHCHYRKVDKIRKIRKDGWPEIQEAVRNDEMKISKAYRLIREAELGKDESGKKASAKLTKAVQTVVGEEIFEDMKSFGEDMLSMVKTACEEFISRRREQERSDIPEPD